jgi:hypothetical protein
MTPRGTTGLGDLTHDARADARARALAAEARRLEFLAALRARDTIAADLGPGPEPDSRYVRYADGSLSVCHGWSKRPRGWGEEGS